MWTPLRSTHVPPPRVPKCQRTADGCKATRGRRDHTSKPYSGERWRGAGRVCSLGLLGTCGCISGRLPVNWFITEISHPGAGTHSIRRNKNSEHHETVINCLRDSYREHKLVDYTRHDSNIYAIHLLWCAAAWLAGLYIVSLKHVNRSLKSSARAASCCAVRGGLRANPTPPAQMYSQLSSEDNSSARSWRTLQ